LAEPRERALQVAEVFALTKPLQLALQPETVPPPPVATALQRLLATYAEWARHLTTPSGLMVLCRDFSMSTAQQQHFPMSKKRTE